MIDAAFRFWSKTQMLPNGCLLWTSAIRNGYGGFWWKGKTVRAHRWAYESIKGSIPLGLTVDHLCRNKLCVNPEHMEVVTVTENNLRGGGPPAQNARKTRCIHGHVLNKQNTRILNGRRKGRACIPCERRRNAARYTRKP